MHRLSFCILGFLLIAATAFAQTTSAESQVVQALLAEMRQLRQDLRTAMVAGQRVQIALYRLQGQEAVLARAIQRLDDARSKLVEAQSNRKNTAQQIQQFENLQSHSQNPTERKSLEETIPQLKARLEMLVNEEQQRQMRETEAESQLRVEQERLSRLQDLLDALDKALEKR